MRTGGELLWMRWWNPGFLHHGVSIFIDLQLISCHSRRDIWNPHLPWQDSRNRRGQWS
jgi:hypothetical protein